MKANHCRARWSQQSVLLQFDADTDATAFEIEPVAAATLAADLAHCIAEYEQSSGTIWSEHHERFGRYTDARLLGGGQQLNDPDGHRLYLLVRGLPLGGIERSFKMLDRALLTERFLVGVGTKVAPLALCAALATKMRIPERFFEAIRTQYSAANFIHVGFEKGLSRSIYKLYLEFPQTELHQGSPKHPLYLGYKWGSHDSQRRATSRYEQLAPLSRDELFRKVESIYGAGNSEVCRSASEILSLATQRIQAEKLLCVDVKDDDTSRVSFDINLYPAEMRVRDISKMTKELSEHFGITPEAIETLLQQTGENDLGHISGGIDRSGAAFLTIYHARATTSQA